MRQYIVRRLLQMIPTIVGVSIIIFFIFALAPGDPISANMDPHISMERKAELRAMYHLDQSKPTQYYYWVKELVTKGSLGESMYYKMPVSKVMQAFIPNSFYLALASLVLGVLIAVPIGVVSATKQYSIFDKAFTIFALIGISIPSFFFGLLLIKWFGVDLKLLPFSGKSTPGANYTGFKAFIDVVKHMALPLTVLTLSSVAGWMRYTRSSMLEVIRQDFIRTARAKGLKEKVVIYKHALRNALIPVITLLGFSIPGLFSGATLTEYIFNWPGIGPVQLAAVNTRDYYLLMGTNLMLAILTLLGNLLADIAYALVDPRIRLK
ncbi:ABC transporter permease [Clostridium sp. C8-1-8]|uniref:ABC transporter permease n=1 Tax=Clostridium sp. C8-1-8 TaxID=2698831 RepID=UPI001371B0C2|nr:ABC transporter permease [Clostridium sp. C8-1-8]